MISTQSKTPTSVDTETTIDIEDTPFDEHLLISGESAYVDTSEYHLHRIGYYWPAIVAALVLVR